MVNDASNIPSALICRDSWTTLSTATTALPWHSSPGAAPRADGRATAARHATYDLLLLNSHFRYVISYTPSSDER